MDTSPINKFKRWIEAPIRKLQELPDGDGTFAALAICCGPYERLIDSSLHAAGKKADPEAFISAAAEDLGCKEEPMRRFWNGFRLGLQHAMQPKAYVENKGGGNSWGWDISEAEGCQKYPEIMQLKTNEFVVRIDPWKFVRHVLERWKEHPELINELEEFELGDIKPIPTEKKESAVQYQTLSPSLTKTGIMPNDLL